MVKDPIVEEVRAVRHEIEKEAGRDPDAYYQHLKTLEEKWRDRLVRRKPQPPLGERVAS